MTWCWWCCHSFDGIPLSMPYKYDEKRNKFHTLGIFCSWSCMKSYTIDKYGVNKGGLICGNIVMMRRKMFNQLGHVKPAPNRFRLVEFGGDLTIEKFRENATVDKQAPPSSVGVVDTEPFTDVSIPFISNTKKMEEINKSNLKNNALKLKRNKPLKRSHNNLESALGLIITPKS